MDWTQVAVFIGVNIALLGSFLTIAIWAVNKIDGDVKSIAQDVKATGARLDGHAKRIDQLYTLFCQSQKENHDKFYELLKDRK